MLLVSEPPSENHCLTYLKILEAKDYLWNLPLLLSYSSTCESVHQTTPTCFFFFFLYETWGPSFISVIAISFKPGIFLLNLFHPLLLVTTKTFEEKEELIFCPACLQNLLRLHIYCILEKGLPFKGSLLTLPPIPISPEFRTSLVGIYLSYPFI